MSRSLSVLVHRLHVRTAPAQELESLQAVGLGGDVGGSGAGGGGDGDAIGSEGEGGLAEVESLEARDLVALGGEVGGGEAAFVLDESVGLVVVQLLDQGGVPGVGGVVDGGPALGGERRGGGVSRVSGKRRKEKRREEERREMRGPLTFLETKLTSAPKLSSSSTAFPLP